MDRLDNPVRPYPWGSARDIPEFRGVPGDGGPQAELWMGAHPGAPSLVQRGGVVRSLAEVIAADPAAGLRAVLTSGLTDGGDQAPAIAALAAAAGRVAAAGGPWAAASAAYAGLATAYPADPGVLVALLLNHVVLATGEALFTAAG